MKEVKTLEHLVESVEPKTSTVITDQASKALSVRVDAERYKRLKNLAAYLEMTHKDILIEGLDMWLQQNEKIKLPQ